ncbi:MAG TPA: hypothetical protein VJ204_05175 [Solirubrobacterales bacterium]|nr:hypothetical protein [Solirubrobacterales bacterium]
MVRRLFLLLAVAMLALPASAMADRYAAPTATGEPNFCLEKANPCSLEKALPLANKGETVWLAEGTYEPVGELRVPEEFVTVSGESSQKPPLIMAKGSTGLNVERTSATVRDLRIHSTAATAVGLRLSLGSTAERVESSGTPQMACLLGTSTLRSTLCETSGGRGIFTSYSVPAGSPSLLIKLFNVTAVGTVAGIEMTAGQQAAVNVYAKNTIALGHTSVITKSTNPGGAGVNINFSHSNFATVEATGETFITPNTAEGNQSAPPVFVDEAAGDYRELPTSPTRWAGTLQELSGTTDLAGQPRTVSCEGQTLVDIGAYQLQECPPPKEPETPEEGETPKEPGTPGGGSGGSGSGGSGNSGSGGSNSSAPTGSTQSVTAPPAPVTPRLSALTLKPRRFAKRTTIAFTLSAPASVKLEVLARRRAKGKKPRLVTLGRLTKAGVAGPNKLAFNGRLKGKPLAPGTYTLRATAAGSSVSTTFTITAR